MFLTRCRTIDKMLHPSSLIILVSASFDGQASMIFSGGTFMPTSDNTAWVVDTMKVVALAWDNAGEDDNAVAMKLRESGFCNIFKHCFQFIC